MDHVSTKETGAAMPYFGAAFAMVGTMIFAPIAWSHYSVLLVVPAMLLMEAALRERVRFKWRYCFALIALVVLALNLYPLSYREILMHAFKPRALGGRSVSLVRSQFYAGLCSMLGMWLLYSHYKSTAGRRGAASSH
jgi:carbon starvation protein CstA